MSGLRRRATPSVVCGPGQPTSLAHGREAPYLRLVMGTMRGEPRQRTC
ncbi:MAG: hypothetical protein U0Q14_00885 [Dermatophilaceae bacterium]